jgi:hypothetical protein
MPRPHTGVASRTLEVPLTGGEVAVRGRPGNPCQQRDLIDAMLDPGRVTTLAAEPRDHRWSIELADAAVANLADTGAVGPVKV